MTVTGIKEAGHTEIQPLLCGVAEAVAVMIGLAVWIVSCYLHTTRKIATEAHLFHTVCLHYQIPVWVLWWEFCSSWPYHYDCV